jgi:protein TonB
VEVLSAPLPSVEKAPVPEPTTPASAEKAPARAETDAALKSNGTPDTTQASVPATPKTRTLVPAVPISQASPSYPELAARTRTSGSVVLQLQINDQGRVTKATPVSGPAMFYDAAVSAALKWRYRPASIDGLNVPSETRVTINFSFKR